MTMIAQPNHPARLAWLFGATLLITGIIGAAIVAGVYVVQDKRGVFDDKRVMLVPDGQIQSGNGLEVVIPVDDPQTFREFTGFAPFVPKRVPRNTDGTPKYAVSMADADGNRSGRVAFSPKKDASTEGITGPIVVLVQSQGVPEDDGDLGQLQRLNDDSTRAIVATIGCGDLTLDMQLFFGPEAQPGEETVTPYMKTVASQFLAELQEACG